MNLESLRERFELSSEALEALQAVGILSLNSDGERGESVEAEDIRSISEAVTWWRAGVEPADIRKIIDLQRSAADHLPLLIQVLTANRKIQLEKLHDCQLRIDRLDFLLRATTYEQTKSGAKSQKIHTIL